QLHAGGVDEAPEQDQGLGGGVVHAGGDSIRRALWRGGHYYLALLCAKIPSMTSIAKKCPFTPGAGHIPPKLAGRGGETAMLDRMLSRLAGDRVKGKERLVDRPYDPVKIIGPRGVGKTVLLSWAKEQAEQQGILVVDCTCLQDDANTDPLKRLLTAMEKGPSKLVKLLREFGFTVPVVGGGLKIKIDRDTDITYDQIVRKIVQKKPLLFLMDEVHNFDPDPLGRMLKYNQLLLREAYPLGVVMAGTPGLNGNLDKAKAGFIDRCREIYINTLSDEATLEALREPLEHTELKVAPDAIEAMAAYTDNYPYFIQIVGELVWDKAILAGRKNVDTAFISQLDSDARRSRGAIYRKAYDRMKEKGLLSHARRVMQVIERSGGEVAEDVVYDLLDNTKSLPGDRVKEVYNGLREDGFIWTVDDITRPGIPSFFSYLKSRDRRDDRSKGDGDGLLNWLSGFVPDIVHRGRRGQ
ncbi:MAG: ATP-binding protein, partial [Ectothiorhodospiraceae bacterium AqS1]|nr:ATP-binding protein [Ectothiorhodospiraceae bacterium AqS1]